MMITRTFRAETMMQALEQVKNDLGTEALVVSARQIPGGSPWQVWRKSMVEVIAVRLEAGEEPSAALSTGSKGKTSPNTGKNTEKDFIRKDTVLPKQISKTGVAQQKQQAALLDVNTSSQTPLSNPGTDQEVDIVEIHGKQIKTNPKDNEKIDLLQQLGRDESIEDMQIVQVPAGSKTVLPPLQLPQLPWKPQQKSKDQLAEAWPVLEMLYNHLIHQGVEPGLVKRICQLSADTLGYKTAMDNNRLVDHLRRQLEVYIKVQRENTKKEHQVICLVGPSGTGKTSFCAKLAVRYRKELKQSVAWVCADTIRTGGIAEAKAYSEAINIPMQVAYTPQELSTVVESFYGNDLIIVDTPACNPRSEESLVEVGALLTVLPNRTTWIVVPATAKENDLVNTVAAYSTFKPRALVTTKMDETNSFGAIYNLALRSQLPFAYFTCGARVLDDLIPAATSRLVQSLFTERFGG